MAWLPDVVMLGSSDIRLSELSLNEETRTLLELALGSSGGHAGYLQQKMEEYAQSKGKCRQKWILYTLHVAVNLLCRILLLLLRNMSLY